MSQTQPSSAAPNPKPPAEEPDDLILATYWHEEGDDEGNRKRQQESISELMGKVAALENEPIDTTAADTSAPTPE